MFGVLIRPPLHRIRAPSDRRRQKRTRRRISDFNHAAGPVSPAPSFQQIQTLTCGKRQGRRIFMLERPAARRPAGQAPKSCERVRQRRSEASRRASFAAPLRGRCSNARDRPRRRAESSNLLFVPTVERGLSEPPYQDAESLNMPPDVQSSAVAGPLDHCKRNGGRPYPCQPQPAFGIYQTCVNRRGSTIKIYPIACL